MGAFSLSCSFVRPLALGLVASLSAIACASSSDSAGVGAGGAVPDEALVASTEEEVRASCTNPRLYFAALHGPCTTIVASRGRWVPEPIFADSPDDVAEGTCAFRWVGAKYARPDREALFGAVGSYENALTPVCGSSAAPGIGEIREIPSLDIWGQAGSVGCDVCGKLRRDRIHVILPPEKIGSRQFMVPLSNGTPRYFQIGATEARALSIDLPPPPFGTTYQAGRVYIY